LSAKTPRTDILTKVASPTSNNALIGNQSTHWSAIMTDDDRVAYTGRDWRIEDNILSSGHWFSSGI